MDDKDKPGYPNIEPEPTGRQKFVGALRRRLVQAGNALDETFAIRNKKIPAEEIGQQTVANTIMLKIGNPLRERLGESRYANPFDITDVMAALGYVGTFHTTDYLKKFPAVYGATKQALWMLEQEGVLESKHFDEPDIRGETIEYKVLDEDKLKQLAVKPQQ